MELKEIYELWDRFDRSTIDELSLEMHGVSFHLKKNGENVQERQYKPQNDQPFAPAGNPVEAHRVELKAPLVGTFYVAPSPDAEPFIQVGQEIHKGDVIGIIEAMKLMNEVVAEADGVVLEILAEDGKMVQYDQVLVTLA